MIVPASTTNAVASVAHQAGATLVLDDVVRTLERLGVPSYDVIEAANDVLSHAKSDAIMQVLPQLHASGTYAFELVPTARRLVDSAHANAITAALTSLRGSGVTGNSTAGDLIAVAAHPQFDRIVALAPDVAGAGTYGFEVIPTARAAVDSGHAERVIDAARALAGHGVSGPSIVADLVKVVGHPQFDRIVEVAPEVVRSGTYSFEAISTARAAVESGHADQVLDAARKLQGSGVSGATVAADLVKVADHPQFDGIVDAASGAHRAGSYSFTSVDDARAAIDSGRGTQILDAAKSLSDHRVTGPSIVADLVRASSDAPLDDVVELAPILQDIGSYSFELVGQARAIARSGRSDEVIDIARQLVDNGVSRASAAQSAIELISAGMSATDVTEAVLRGASLRGIDPLRGIVDSRELATRSLDELAEALLTTSHGDASRQSAVLGAMSRRISETAPIDDVDRDLLASIRELVDRNHARTTGARHDGFSTYPDFAELGRIDAITKLRGLRVSSLHTPAVAEPNAVAAATSAAASDAETLAW